jgi:glycogen phosphorylase
MKVLGRITVFPIMPARISRLYELAYNLWWSWRPEARALYRTLEPDIWDDVGHNPVRFLSAVSPKLLEEAAQRDDYLQAYDSFLRDFDFYMHPRPEDTCLAPCTRWQARYRVDPVGLRLSHTPLFCHISLVLSHIWQ